MTAEKHIVLIDDEIDVVEAVSEMLELEGFSVTTLPTLTLALNRSKQTARRLYCVMYECHRWMGLRC